jgi:hypothetical protein
MLGECDESATREKKKTCQASPNLVVGIQALQPENKALELAVG